MTSRTLRLTYRLLRIAALADRVEFLKKKYPGVSPGLIDEIVREKIDPTGGKYLEWLVRGFANKSYPPGFWEYAREIMQMYTELVKSPTLAEMYGVSRDINKMDPKGLYDIWERESIGRDKEDLASEALRAKKVKQEGSRVIYDKNGYKVVQFGGPEMNPEMAIKALCMFGAGTGWCTRKDKQARSYLENGPVYMIFKGISKVAQVSEDQIQDPENNPVYLKRNSELTQVLVESEIISPKSAYNLLSRGWGEKGPWPELEPALAKDSGIAFKYASHYLYGRFPLGEKAIAQSPEQAFSYALMIMEDRFPEGEETILKDPLYGPIYQQYLDGGYFDYLRERREREHAQIQNT